MSIVIKSDREIRAMREAGRVVAVVLGILSKELMAGMKTRELDAIAGRELVRLGAKSSFKGYHGFPANVCVSVNDEIVHGIPGERVLAEGDVVSLDFGAIWDGFQGDAAVTVGVGKITPEAKRLIAATEGALEAGIAKMRGGARLGDVSAAIQEYAESKGFEVIREYTGHGIGREMHEEPQIANFGVSGTGPVLRRGMALALEPMLCTGDWHTRVASDHWTVLTANCSLAAHFEHTVVVTDGEPEILTAL
jgi:methionyl aminopeptidase